jgi:hypothetical protein
MELKNKKLELEENDQIIDMLKAGSTDSFKKEKAELDRESKKEIKSMDILSKLGIEEDKLEAANERELIKFLKEMLKDRAKDDKDLDMVGLNTLAKLALEQLKKEKINDEEG